VKDKFEFACVLK